MTNTTIGDLMSQLDGNIVLIALPTITRIFFFFKQKTAYEFVSGDWSSDVCSSDLGLGIHFIHVRGTGPAPLPLVITHGWPGSVAEFVEVIGPLTDPARHGGDPADAFDVVAPSMPGYGFSDHPTEPGMDTERIAALWAELMAGLGYQRFGAQGGDWGAMVTTYLGARHADRLIGIHLNMVIAFPEDTKNPPLDGV